jgi:hypothetical protein
MHGFALKAMLTSIVALTTTPIGQMAVFAPAAPPGDLSTNERIQHAHAVHFDRPLLGQPCLIGTPSCLSLFQKAPAPCLVSTERCEIEGRVMNLTDAQLHGERRR